MSGAGEMRARRLTELLVVGAPAASTHHRQGLSLSLSLCLSLSLSLSLSLAEMALRTHTDRHTHTVG
jgi:hypothetical protein